MRRNLLFTLIALGLLMVVTSVMFVQGRVPTSPCRPERLEGVARGIVRDEDKIKVADLAAWTIEGRQNFVLVDVRTPEEYTAGHIQGARNLPITDLLSAKGIGALPDDRKVVLYAGGTATAAQAAALLRMANVDAYALVGGYEFWLEYTTSPEAGARPDEDRYARRERQAVNCFFQGDYAAAGGIPVQAAPAPAAPAPGAKADPLGLGLGLGLGPQAPPAPAAPAAKADPLGLGLGPGLGPQAPSAPAPAAPPARPDPLGLGLGLGLGPQGEAPAPPPPAAVPVPAPAPGAVAPGESRPGLLIGEGC
jgi:rhodanese-related sulfurtransferase